MTPHDPNPPGERGPDSAQLEAAKRQSVSQLLFKCARLLNERGMDAVRARRDTPIRKSHTNLFPHIPLFEPGIRLTDLAQLVGVSKQAVGQTVGELVQMGIVARQPDPEDKRAKQIVYTEHGRAAVMDGLQILADIEKDLARRVGEPKMRALHEALLALEDALDQHDCAGS